MCRPLPAGVFNCTSSPLRDPPPLASCQMRPKRRATADATGRGDGRGGLGRSGKIAKRSFKDLALAWRARRGRRELGGFPTGGRFGLLLGGAFITLRGGGFLTPRGGALNASGGGLNLHFFIAAS